MSRVVAFGRWTAEGERGILGRKRKKRGRMKERKQRMSMLPLSQMETMNALFFFWVDMTFNASTELNQHFR